MQGNILKSKSHKTYIMCDLSKAFAKSLDYSDRITKTRDRQMRFWRAGVLQSLAPTLIKHIWTS